MAKVVGYVWNYLVDKKEDEYSSMEDDCSVMASTNLDDEDLDDDDLDEDLDELDDLDDLDDEDECLSSYDDEEDDYDYDEEEDEE